MNTGAPITLRIPLIVLAFVDLALLARRLWPWVEAAYLPGNGTTAFDPAMSLLGYIGLILWINSGQTEEFLKALAAGTRMGLPGGLLLAASVVPAVQAHDHSGFQQPALFAAAGILWGIGGLRGSRLEPRLIAGMVCGIWSAMVSSLIGCAAILAEMYLATPGPVTQDPWKQYEGLAIGSNATQALVHSLNTMTAFLLVAPLAGGAMGFVFAFFRQKRAS
jgi:hypothetical protein